MQSNSATKDNNPYLHLVASEDGTTRQTFVRKTITPDQISSNCMELILVRCYPEIPSNQIPIHEKKSPSNLKVSLIGLGDTSVDDRAINFLKHLQTLNFIITDLIIYDYEIKPKILPFIFESFPKLTSLNLINVPLDNSEILAIQNLKHESLEYLNLSHTDPDFVVEDKLVSLPEKLAKYSFLENFPGLKYLYLTGVSLETKDFDILNSIGKRIIHLGLENLKAPSEALFALIQNLSTNFPDLVVLSLADNDLEKINIPQFDPNFLPESLKVLNLNNAGLTTALLGLFLSRNKKFNPEELYFRGNLINDIRKSPAIYNLFTKNTRQVIDVSTNPLTQEDLNLLAKNFGEALDVSLIKSNAKGKVSKSDDEHKNLQHVNVNFEIEDEETLIKPQFLGETLIENQKNLKKLDNIFEEKKSSDTDFQSKSDRFDFARAAFKGIRYTDNFFGRKQGARPVYLTDYNRLIASSNLENMNALPQGYNGNQPIPIHDTQMIRLMIPHAEALTRDDQVTGTFQEQMVYFREFMERLGYTALTREIEAEECEEQLYRVFLPENTVTHDLRIVMFTVRWYKAFEQVNLEFTLSDDWFQSRQERVNRVSIQNQDVIVTLLNHLNNHIKDFSFHLSSEAWDRTSDNPDDDEEIYFIDAGFKKSFLFLDKMNLTREILISIDQAFIVLKMLLEEDLYDMELQPENFDQWAMSFWKAAKNNIRRYKESKEFKLAFKRV